MPRPGRYPEDHPLEQQARRELVGDTPITVGPGPQVSQTNGGATQTIKKATFRGKRL